MNDQKKFSEFYLNQLATTYSGLNLTRITDSNDFYEKQVVDSLMPFEIDDSLSLRVKELGYLVDVGFGGGFPILPLRNYFNVGDVRILGFDSRRKKVDAVRDISNKFGMKNIIFDHNRIENIFLDIPCFVTLKAVGDVNKMLKLIKCTSGTFILFYKAKNFEALEPSYRNNKDYKFIKMKKFSLGGNERCFVLFRKIKHEAEDKSLVKLSDFVFN